MRRKIAAALSVLFLLELAACGGTAASVETAAPAEAPAQSETPAPTAKAEPSDTVENPSESSTILIAYFSHTGENYNVGVIDEGNTAKVAKEIAAQTGGDLFEIVTVEPYPESYDDCLAVATEELRSKARPELAATMDSIEQYDTVYLGYPIWWGDLPMAVYAFLERYDFSGKTVLPFNTHEGSGTARTDRTIRSLLPDADVRDGLAIRGSTAQNDAEAVTNAVRDFIE